MKLPSLVYEKELWSKGYVVVGVDEVGRGSFAGPIVASACAFAPQIKNVKFKMQNEKIIICDSKQLSAHQREDAAAWIKEHSLVWGIGEVDVKTINAVGIAKAGILALRRAVVSCLNGLIHEGKPYVLSDYFSIPHLKGVGLRNQTALVKGDEKCFSIAAASILAKVHRDEVMRKLSEQHNSYGWERNKGYGTKEHRAGLKEFGPSQLHRSLFIRNVMSAH